MQRNWAKFSCLLLFAIILPAIYNPINSMESKSDELSNHQEFIQSKPLNTIYLSNKNVKRISVPPIEWGVLSNYFEIENVKAGIYQQVNPYTGKVEEFPLLKFTVEAKRSFYTTLFYARFYDSENIEVDSFSPIKFEPLYDTWNQGMRSRANIVLPIDMSKVAVIKFSQL